MDPTLMYHDPGLTFSKTRPYEQAVKPEEKPFSIREFMTKLGRDMTERVPEPSTFFEQTPQKVEVIQTEINNTKIEINNFQETIKTIPEKDIPIINFFIDVSGKLIADIFKIEGDYDSSMNNLLTILKSEIQNVVSLIEKVVLDLKITNEKLDKLKVDLTFYSRFISTQIDYHRKETTKNFISMNIKLDCISNSLSSLEKLTGDGFKELQWRNVYLLLDDYCNYQIRYGRSIPSEKVYSYLQTIECLILNPPMIEWLSLNYFHSVKHTQLVDDTHFKDKFYMGWLVNKPIIPFDILNELLKVYEFLKREVDIYDPRGIIYGKIIDKIRSYDTVIPKSELQKKSRELKTLKSKREALKREFSEEKDELYQLTLIKKRESVSFIDEELGFEVFFRGQLTNANSLIESSKRAFQKETKKFFFSKGNSPYYVWDLTFWCENSSQELRINFDLKTFIEAEKLCLGTLVFEYFITFTDAKTVFADHFGVYVLLTSFFIGDISTYSIHFTSELRCYWKTDIEKIYIGNYNFLTKGINNPSGEVEYFSRHTHGSDAEICISPYTLSYYITKELKTSKFSLFKFANFSIERKLKEKIFKINSEKEKIISDDLDCQIRKLERFLTGIDISKDFKVSYFD